MQEVFNIEQTIRGYLPQIVHMSLGTSKDNKPWVCEVHVAYDDDLNLYFRSLTSRRHSQEIAANLTLRAILSSNTNLVNLQ